MIAIKQNTCRISIFRKCTNQDRICNRGLYQRCIIASLAIEPSKMTKRALSKDLAQKFGISVGAAYDRILRELNESLIPDGIVQEAGSVPPIRGPKILRVTGIPFYSLTDIGILTAASLDELNVNERSNLLQEFLASKTAYSLNDQEKKELLYHLEKYPKFTLEMIKNGVSQFIDQKIEHPLDIIHERQKI